MFYYLNYMTFYEQIQNSIDYIENNLNDSITAKKAADTAFMSIANYYRYFTALTGFSYKEYVRKRRLTQSLDLLHNKQMNIIDIAFDSLFESHEAFTRAFKKEFGISPSSFRKSYPDLKGINPKKLYKEQFMGIIIKELPPMEVAFYRVISKAPENDCWNHIKKWSEGSKVFDNPYRIFGFNNPGPDEVNIITDKRGKDIIVHSDNSEYGYEFQITLNDRTILGDGEQSVGFKTIPGGKFAVMSIGVGCDQHDIGKGWAAILKVIKEKDFKPTGRWFEEHLEYNGDEDNFRMDLYIEIE